MNTNVIVLDETLAEQFEKALTEREEIIKNPQAVAGCINAIHDELKQIEEEFFNGIFFA